MKKTSDRIENYVRRFSDSVKGKKEYIEMAVPFLDAYEISKRPNLNNKKSAVALLSAYETLRFAGAAVPAIFGYSEAGAVFYCALTSLSIAQRALM